MLMNKTSFFSRQYFNFILQDALSWITISFVVLLACSPCIYYFMYPLMLVVYHGSKTLFGGPDRSAPIQILHGSFDSELSQPSLELCVPRCLLGDLVGAESKSV